MIIRHSILVSLLGCFAVGNAHAQTANHPWHVNDQGGGASGSGGLRLRSSIGQPAIQGGASAGIVLEPGYIPGTRLVAVSGALEVQTEEQWNLLSVPYIVDDFRKTTIYPAATSAAFVYAGAYQPEDTLRVGVGFWLKFDSVVTVPFEGPIVDEETVDVLDKWNILGSLSHPIPVANIAAIPPASVVSNFFGYSGNTGYTAADTLQPGYGYWVKVGGAGKIVLTTSSSGVPPVAGAAAFRRGQAERDGQGIHPITVRDVRGRERTVWFSSSTDTTDHGNFQLPPLPPGGLMDVRFETDRLLEAAETGKTRDVAVKITAAEYPVTIGWKVIDERGHPPMLLVDGREIELRGTGTMTIESPPSGVRLRLAPASSDPVPTGYALAQNHPNPFNPTTKIRFDVPVAGLVSLSVYDILGREVTVLANEVMEPGSRMLEWDASGRAGGVYYLRMTAGSFSTVRKMLLLR